MLGRVLPILLAVLLLAAVPVQAAPACESVAAVADRTVARGECLALGPGATVTGTLVVEGRLVAEGTADAPILVTGPIQVRGSASIAHAAFSDGGLLEAGTPSGPKADLLVADASFAFADGERGIALWDGFRAEIARATFAGAGTGVAAAFAGRGSDLAILDSAFAGPGAAVDINFAGAGGERLHLQGNTFRGDTAAAVASSWTAEHGLVALRGGEPGGAPSVATLAGNTFEGGAAGLVLDSANYRLYSTEDAFRGNGAGVVILQQGRNAIFDRATFEDNLRYDLVTRAGSDATVKDPVVFDPAKVFVTESSEVSFEQGKSRIAITYDYMMEHRGATAGGAAALGMLLLGLSRAGRGLALKGLFLPLYARLSPEQVMNHEKRQDILQFISTNPGVHLRRIGHSLDISYGTLTYHLYRLEREGYITYAQEGLFKRYYTTAGRMKQQAKERPLPTQLRDLERQIYDTIVASPGSAQSAIAQQLGLSRQALHYHIKKLEKSGFITKVPSGRETLIYATNPADGTPAAPAAAEAASNT